MTALFESKKPFPVHSADAARISSALSASVTRAITAEVLRLQREFVRIEAKRGVPPITPNWLERVCAGCYLTVLAVVFGWAVVGRELWDLIAVFRGE